MKKSQKLTKQVKDLNTKKLSDQQAKSVKGGGTEAIIVEDIIVG